MKIFNLGNKQNLITLLSLALIAIFGIIAFLRSTSPTTAYSKTGFYFDTIVDITLYDLKDQEKANRILEAALMQCSYYERLYSRTKEGSDIYKINHANGASVMVNPETILLLSTALEYAKLSDGLVDPSVGSLSSLWNIKADDFELPNQAQLDEALSHIDYHGIMLDTEASTVTLKDPKMQLDLGFIAKGYIADRIKEKLLACGVNSAIINLGGNVLCINAHPNGTPFEIGIKDPQSPETNIITKLQIDDQSIVSSGDYERFKVIDGISYHHILSTKNGYPASSDLSQVTIISSSSVEGDALSTLCFILGYDKSMELLKSNYPHVEAIFVDTKGNILNAQ